MESKKGIELQTNALIILVLALLLLAVAIAIYTGTFTHGSTTTKNTGNFYAACGNYVSGHCCPGTSGASMDCPSLGARLSETATQGGIANPVQVCCRT